MTEHPRVDIVDPYATDTNARLVASIEASPTGAVRVFYPGDTEASADTVALEGGTLVTLDTGAE